MLFVSGFQMLESLNVFDLIKNFSEIFDNVCAKAFDIFTFNELKKV